MNSYYTPKSVNKTKDNYIIPYHFTGDLADPPPTKTVEVECISDYLRSWCSTGYYLLPGQKMRMEVLSTDNTTWQKFQVSLMER